MYPALDDVATNVGVTEWDLGPYLLHQVDEGHFELYGPDYGTESVLNELAEFGIGRGWERVCWDIGDVAVCSFIDPTRN